MAKWEFLTTQKLWIRIKLIIYKKQVWNKKRIMWASFLGKDEKKHKTPQNKKTKKPTPEIIDTWRLY